jgi:hypothetical protein
MAPDRWLSNHRQGRSRRLAAVVLAAAVLATGPALAESGSPSRARVFCGFWAYELNYDIDCTLDILGPTHFFSSRQQEMAGGRMVLHAGADGRKHVWLGMFGGLAGTKSKFRLNWETPGVMSYDPLDASITTLTIPVGLELNVVLGNILHLAPYASAMWLVQLMQVKIQDNNFSGSTSKFAVGAGLEATLRLGKIRLTAGAGRAHVLGENMDIDVDDLTFSGRYTKPSTEYFAGVTIP